MGTTAVAGVDPPGLRAGATALIAVMFTASLPGLTEGLDIDHGTRIYSRQDARALITGTHLGDFHVTGTLVPTIEPTRMQRIRELAPLSLRQWADVFGVSHTTARSWEVRDPERAKLTTVLGFLQDANRYHARLADWLNAPLPGMAVKPLDLLREDKWRALRGALRARISPAVTAPPSQLMARRRLEETWTVAEPDITSDE